MKSESYISIEDKFGAKNYKPLDVVLTHLAAVLHGLHLRFL